MSTSVILIFVFILHYASTFILGIKYDGIDLTPYKNSQYTDTIDSIDITQGKMKQFRINVTDDGNGSELHIYVTPWGSCDFDLHVSWTIDTCDDMLSNHKYDASKQDDHFGSKFVIINASQLSDKPFICVAIQGWTPGQYSILYTYNRNNRS